MLTISISSTALFDLSESERVYREEGLEAYRNYQITAEDEVLQPGEGFALVKKILNIGKNLNGYILILDLINLSFRKVKLKKLKISK